jgi:hypothetical protein
MFFRQNYAVSIILPMMPIPADAMGMWKTSIPLS